MSKEYNENEVAKILVKSMWKSVKKAMGKNPVSDVLDSNLTREAAPKTVPADKESVMNKAPEEKAGAPKPKKLHGFISKRQGKLKNKKKL